MAVSESPECVLRLTVLEETTDPGKKHKFKVGVAAPCLSANDYKTETRRRRKEPVQELLAYSREI